MTKRKDIIKTIAHYAKTTGQQVTIKEGAKHTQVRVGTNVTYIPRHTEIAHNTAKAIYKQIGIQQ